MHLDMYTLTIIGAWGKIRISKIKINCPELTRLSSPSANVLSGTYRVFVDAVLNVGTHLGPLTIKSHGTIVTKGKETLITAFNRLVSFQKQHSHSTRIKKNIKRL